MKTKFFLTFNDIPNGIFSSQVIDVCRYLRSISHHSVRLVSFISIRNYFAVRKQIRALEPHAVVVPMFPGIQNWRINGLLLRVLYIIFKPDVIIARGPFATMLALDNTGATVCFDARGAYYGEFSEYNVAGGAISNGEIRIIESNAVQLSHMTISVSNALVEYWRKMYNYSGAKHVVIPCTLNSDHLFTKPNITDCIRIVFSGGNGPWQNINVISDYLIPLFKADSRLELIIMTPHLPTDFLLYTMFPQRVKHIWVAPSDVGDVLASCDYGWLVRENTVTNSVASPVKFAEYLAAGLNVIISDNLGDFSDYVKKNECGIVLKSGEKPGMLTKPDMQDKLRIQEIAGRDFMKPAYFDLYKRILCE